MAQPAKPPLATLAICSDLDETPDAQTYFELMRFLNTTKPTAMGDGVGLEISNSIYFDMAPSEVSYWNVDDSSREKFRVLIRSGHIDCLHSYGDLATTRAHAGKALDELAKYDCRLPIWVDHAQAITNFGEDIMVGSGDVPGHPAYHADLTMQSGIRYIWRGRVTSVIGQDKSASLSGVADWAHPIGSAKTVGKELVKNILGRTGSRKYRVHGTNQLLWEDRLRDGRPVREFLRCNPHWQGVSCCDTGWGISEVLNTRFLDRLAERKSCCVLYTHLGKLAGEKTLNTSAVAAFRRLADYQRAGKIKVVSTARLLDQASAFARGENNPTTQPLAFPDI